MSTVRRVAAVVVSATLLSGAFTVPAAADQYSRSSDPEVSDVLDVALEDLQVRIAQIRTDYAAEMVDARAERDERLAAPRAKRRAALRKADTKKERRKARRVYRRNAAPIVQEYRTVRRMARAERNALIDEALANYVVRTDAATSTTAAQEYRAATAIAGDTLSLALASARETFWTDNADERAQLMADLEDASTNAERVRAWRAYQLASADDRQALLRAIAAARATYASALAEARRAYDEATGGSIMTQLKVPLIS